MGEMELLDVFVDRSDFERRHIPGNILELPMIQIQMYPDDMTAITDANWPKLREMLPRTMASEGGRVATIEGGENAKNVSRQSDSIVDITDMKVGDVVIYHNDHDGVRWINRASMAFEGHDEPLAFVMATAAQRVGRHLYLVRLVARARTDGDVKAATASLDGWLKNIWSSPNP